MTTATEAKTSKQIYDSIPETNRKLAEQIMTMVTVDTTSGLAPENEKGSVYKVGLEAHNVTPEEANRVHAAETGIVASHSLAINMLAAKTFADNKDLGTVQGTIAMNGDNTFTAGVNREAIGRNPKTGETSTIHHQPFNSYSVNTSANKGVMAKIRSYAKAVGQENSK